MSNLCRKMTKSFKSLEEISLKIAENYEEDLIIENDEELDEHILNEENNQILEIYMDGVLKSIEERPKIDEVINILENSSKIICKMCKDF